MKEPHAEGPATHGDPESCTGGARDKPEAAGEALTGAHAGRALSRDIIESGAPTSFSQTEGNTFESESASPRAALRGLRPQACVEPPCARTGRSPVRPRVAPWTASERQEAVPR